MTMKQKARPCSETTKTATTTATLIVQASEDRTSLLLSAQALVYISSFSTVTPGKGIKLGGFFNNLQMCQCHQGDFVKRPLWAITDVSAEPVDITVIEGFEPWPPNNLPS